MRRQIDKRIRVSFTLPGTMVQKIGRMAGPNNRSKLVVAALQSYIASCEAQSEMNESTRQKQFDAFKQRTSY